VKNIFLTSDLGCSKKIDGTRVAKPLDNTNGFIENLKSKLNGNKKMVLIASSENEYDTNDYYANLTFESFKLSGLEFDQYIILDGRNESDAKKIIENADLIILTGGFTLGQMNFFNKINLKDLLKNSKFVIVGQSAGSINLASKVYCSPESFEELNNPRTWDGLGMTNINIEPHFIVVEDKLDEEGKVMRKELLKDSFEYPLYAIADGSYIYDDGNNKTIFGESYFVNDGIASDSLCINGETYIINKK